MGKFLVMIVLSFLFVSIIFHLTDSFFNVDDVSDYGIHPIVEVGSSFVDFLRRGQQLRVEPFKNLNSLASDFLSGHVMILVFT